MTPFRPLSALLFIGIFFVANAVAGTSDLEPSPLMPERIEHPYADVKKESTLSGAAQLSKFLRNQGITLRQLNKTIGCLSYM